MRQRAGLSLFPLFAMGLLAGAPASAQTWPTRAIHLVMPAPAGGNNDGIARILAQGMSDILKVPVVVENRTGAGGATGTQYVATQPPDGHTLLFVFTGTISIMPLLKQQPYDPRGSFLPVSMVATTPLVLVAPKSLGVSDLEGFVKKAKENPGKFNYSSAGIGTILHMAMEAFRLKAGIDIVHVPYSNVPMIQPMLGNQVQASFDATISAAPHIESGALTPLAVTGAAQTATLPGVPTMGEKGYPGMEPRLAWMGLMTPAGASPDVVAKLNATVRQVMGDPAIRDRVVKLGAEPMFGSPQDMRKFLDENEAFWRGVITGAKISIDN